MNWYFTKSHPLRLFLGLLAIIFAGELNIMFILDQVLDGARPQWLEALLDAGLLTLLCTPFFWQYFLKPMQSALEQECSKAQVVMEMAAEGIISLNEAGLIQTCNQAARQIFGYSDAEMHGKNILKLITSFDLNTLAEHKTSEASGLAGAQVRDAFGMHQNGTAFPVELAVSELNLAGRRQFAMIVRDISKRRADEHEKEALQQNMKALLNAIQESTFLLEKNGEILIVNEVAARRLNALPAELVGKNIYDILPHDVMQFRRAKFEQIIQRGLPETYEDEREGRRYLTTVCPVRGGSGDVSGFAVYAADVTQQRRLQGIEELFSEINQLVLQGVPLNTLLIVACKKVTDLFRFSVAWVGRKESDGSIAILAGGGIASRYVDGLKQTGVRWDDTPQGQGPSGSAIRYGQSQVFSVNDPRFDAWSRIALENNLQSMLAIPLLIRDEIHGVFTLYSSEAAFFDTPSVIEMMTGVAMRISVAMESAMDQQQTRLLSSALVAAGNGVMITNAQGIIQWVNPAFSKMCGYHVDELVGQTPRILKSGRQAPAYYQALWATIAQGETWNSETTERAKDGTLYTVSQTITPIKNDENKIVYYIAIHEDVTAQKLSQERIEHMAHYDALTNLPNRALFYDRLQQAFTMARRSKGGLALLFLDLDGFKQVNDSLGHHIGDLLLIAVAERLRECVRESDTVARLGGDEFTVILKETHDHDSVAKVAEKIIEAIAIPYELEGKRVRVGVSIGIARYSEEAGDEDELMNEADQAMYAAKSAGKNTYRFGTAAPTNPVAAEEN